MSRALQDIVLVDFTTEFWASLAAAMLADFGARVIRLENLPEAGENRGNRDGQHPPSDWDYRAELVQWRVGKRVDCRLPRPWRSSGI